MSLDIELIQVRPSVIYSDNITHNLGNMAKEAGLYYPLWRPEEIGLTKAAELLPFFDAGLLALKNEPAKFIRCNPANGWGTYECFVKFVEDYREACLQNPNAEIRVCR